jgi:hypothetical protein
VADHPALGIMDYWDIRSMLWPRIKWGMKEGAVSLSHNGRRKFWN